jgi:hypothetical protein
MHQDWVAARVLGGCALALSVLGAVGSYLIWRRRPRPAAAA